MFCYSLLSLLLLPFLPILLAYRLYRGKELKTRWQERFAIATTTNTQPLIWLHAVSIGEVNSAFWLIEQLLQQHIEHKLLITSTTTTSATIIAQKINNNQLFKNRVLHQFLPFDSYFIVKKFLNYWRPQIAIFVESEIWPNIIWQTNKMQIPLVLVNARLSLKSYKFWQFCKNYCGINIFAYFDTIFAQSNKDYNLFANFIAQDRLQEHLFYYGNLKFLLQPATINQHHLAELQQQINNRPCFIASNTHHPEELEIIKTHNYLRQYLPNLLTIIIIRHPDRSSNVAKMHDKISLRSLNQTIQDATEFYLVDTIGEVQLFYQLAKIVFMGGSLINIGGHNPCEAIANDCAIVSGSNIYNNQQIYNDLLQQNACLLIHNQEQLQKAILDLLQNKDLVHQLATNAKNTLLQQNQQTKIISKISEFLVKKNLSFN